MCWKMPRSRMQEWSASFFPCCLISQGNSSDTRLVTWPCLKESHTASPHLYTQHENAAVQTSPHYHPWRRCSLYSLTLKLDNGGGSSHPCPPLDCLKRWQSDNTCPVILADSMSLLQKVKSVMCWWLTSAFKNSCRCTALDMPEWREMTEQIDWRAKQPSQMACFSEDLKCWEASDATSRHKAKDITTLTACRRKVLKEEALDDLHWKDERGQLSIRQTLEPFQRQCWGNFWETGWSTYGFFRAQTPSWTELDWTELPESMLKRNKTVG